MAEGKRIFWTEFEQSEVYRVFTELAAQKKIHDRPIPNVYGKDGGLMMNLLRQAQLVLPDKRRRPLGNIDAVPTDLGDRLALHGYFPKNWKQFYRRTKEKRPEPVVETDPRDARIQELEEGLRVANETISASQDQNGRLMERISELEKQPTPAQMVQRYIAETLAMAFKMANQTGPGMTPIDPTKLKPPVERRHEDIPSFERDRRKDPVAAAQGEERPAKPRICVVGGMGKDFSIINDAVKDHAEMRYIERGGDTSKLDGLRMFNANYGRIILWTNFISHQIEDGLKARGVTYSRFTGSLPNLIEKIKGMIIESRK